MTFNTSLSQLCISSYLHQTNIAVMRAEPQRFIFADDTKNRFIVHCFWREIMVEMWYPNLSTIKATPLEERNIKMVL